MSKHRIIIVGSQGQDGRLLNEMLDHNPDVTIYKIKRGDINLTSYSEVKQLCQEVVPTHIYYLAAAHASSEIMHEISFKEMEKINYMGIKNFVDACNELKDQTWIFYPSSSKLFPSVCRVNEYTKPEPSCFYGETKLAGSNYVLENTDSSNRFVPILFNHESIYRNKQFLSKKIIMFIKRELESLELRRPDDCVDWGLSSQFCMVFYQAALQRKSGVYVVGTGVCTSIRKMLLELSDEYDLGKFVNLVDQISPITNREADISKLRKNFQTVPSTFGADVIRTLLRVANV